MDERTEHLANLFEKMGNCPTIEAERANYDEIFAMLESEGNADGIEALQNTFRYRKFALRETIAKTSKQMGGNTLLDKMADRLKS